MTASSPTSPFLLGLRDGLPFIVVVGPFALLFGVVATEAGLQLSQTMAFSTVVIAGASQFAALQQIQIGAPTLMVVATALAVNLRMAMYSAALTPWLGPAPFWQRALIAYAIVDQTYALSVARFEQNPAWSIPQRVRYFFGTVTPILTLWVLLTAVGMMVGAAIPGWLAMDFAVPICFLAIIGPMLRTPAHMAAALTSILLALVFSGLPYGSGLLLAAVCAMIVGARVEIWAEARRT